MIEWQAPEYQLNDKSHGWSWGVGVIGGLGAFAAILFKNFLLAIILALGTATTLLYRRQPPETITFALTPEGVRIHRQLYPYSNLKSFWVNTKTEDRKIIIETNQILTPHLILPLNRNLDPEQISKYLVSFLPEVRHENSLFDILGDMLGF